MDIQVLKTFLEVNKAKHFGKAAENMYLTQAAVSTRIKQLEKMLGCQLFIRYRNNLQLTAAGTRLVPHAEGIVVAWERARQDLALSQNRKEMITIAASSGVWDLCLSSALANIQQHFAKYAFRAEVLQSDHIVRRLKERTLDFALLYEPAKVSELVTRSIGKIELVLACHCETDDPSKGFVSVDWGTTFDMQVAQFHYENEHEPPALHTTSARIALEFILVNGGCAYLPKNMINSHLAEATLKIIEAPVISREIHACFHEENRKESIINEMIELTKASIEAPAVS